MNDHGRQHDARQKLPTFRTAIAPAPVLLGLVFLVYGLLTWQNLNSGYLEYNADGYARIMRGYTWMLAPRWEVGVWLPLQTWLIGSGLFLRESLTSTPQVLSVGFTLLTLTNLFLIGRRIAGDAAGFLAALIGAVFPWILWFGPSGMAESLFSATITTGALGLACWTFDPRLRWLGLASTGFLLSTMVRYEGWFYSAVFLLIVLAIAWRRNQRDWRILLLVALPMVFPLIWMQQHWELFGSPVQFAHDTSAIKESETAENVNAGLIRKLTIYPLETARLAPRLALLCALAVAFAAWKRVRWWPLMALVAGQALLLIGITAGFSNLGPGAERYLLTNMILLFPMLAAALLHRSRLIRAGLLVLLVIAMLPVVQTAVEPPTGYPDADTREVIERYLDWREAAEGTYDPIPVLLQPAPAEGFNASYAFQVLSNDPESWRLTSDPALFQAWIDTTRPPFWLLDTVTGYQSPDAATIEPAGRWTIGWLVP